MFLHVMTEVRVLRKKRYQCECLISGAVLEQCECLISGLLVFPLMWNVLKPLYFGPSARLVPRHLSTSGEIPLVLDRESHVRLVESQSHGLIASHMTS